MFNNLINNIKNKITELDENNKEYEEIINNSKEIENLSNIENLERKEISPYTLTSKNPNITKDKAILIIDLLPINELYLEVLYTKELKTKKEYFLVPTINNLWIISKEGYKKYDYNELEVKIIKENIFTKTIYLLNHVFEIQSTKEEIDNFINIINNIEYRTKIINDTKNKFGENEVYRTIHNNNSGLSYDKNYNIRFYTKDTTNIYNIKDISNYELLIDNNVIQEKKMSQNHRITSNKNSCYEIKIRITTNNNVFEIPILEKDAMATMYSNTSDTYITNIEYAKKLIKILDDINDRMIYGNNIVE